MTVVNATAGRDLGTRPSRRLRGDGQLPGVVYGQGIDPVAVQVSYLELRDALKGEAGLNTVFTLDVDGDQATVIVRDIQRDPIKRTVTHADFMRISEDSKVKGTEFVGLVGRASKVIDNGGMIEQKRHNLLVLVAPNSIPHQIEVDITDMDMEHRLAVGELVMPEGVVSLIDANLTVAATVVPRGIKADEDEDELGEEGEEGEEGEGAESSDDADSEG